MIALDGVSKHYASVVALDNVTLDVRPGEIYALLGLNGAGKTTLIRTVLGMIHPTAGQVRVAGRPVTDRRVWSQVGYLVETPAAYPELTVRQNLDVVRRLRRVTDRSCIDRVLDLFALRPYADRRARTLSLGNAQRLGLAKALLHRPSLVVLDEPVNGLDPAGVVEIRSLLMDLAREHGMTVLLSSHLLDEVARIATRIGVVHHGRLIDEFDSTALTARVRPRLEVGVRDLSRATAALHSAGIASRTSPGGLTIENDWAVEHPDSVATMLVRAGEPPTRLAVTQDDLETYFLRLVDEPGGLHAEVTNGR
jgi:ABC-2 type transport system ATP-binding protein